MTDGNDRQRLVCRIDRGMYDVTNCLPGNRNVAMEDIKKAIEGSQVEHRLKSIAKFRIYPNAEAQDLSEWDKGVLLDTYQPHYLDTDDSCSDCLEGRCNLSKGNGRCGLTAEAFQAKTSLKVVCRGCLGQMMTSRRMLDYCLRRYGKEQPVTMGKEQDITDATWVGIMCGFYPEKLEHLDRAMSYAEGELGKALHASVQGCGAAVDFEQISFHAGTMLLLAQEVAEYLGISFFGFTTAMDYSLADVAWYPPGFQSGMKLIKQENPTLGFVGDDFIPAWLAVSAIKDRGLADTVQIVGIGAAGDSIARFHNKVYVAGTMYRAKKVLRQGLIDVLVAGECCVPFDFTGEVRKTGTKLIWTGVACLPGTVDWTGEAAESIAAALLGGEDAVSVRDVEKAVQVALLVMEKARAHSAVVTDQDVLQEASRCRADCDICSFACPNDLGVGQGIRDIGKAGLTAMFDVEKACALCGKCEKACPEHIRIEDIVVAAFGSRNADESFLFRPGRGPITRSEVASYGFTFFPGNSPGIFGFIGCSNCNPEDIGWMASQVAETNGIVSVSGCAAADVGHVLDAEGVPVYRKYPFWASPRALANLGGCAACQYHPWIVYKYSRTGTGISWCANYAETMDEMFGILNTPITIWGGAPERMYALATGLARTGLSVVIGPVNSQQWKRLLGGNKWDWKRYWWYDSLSHQQRPCSPSPKDLITAVETKEEAVTRLMSDNMKAIQPFIMRMLPLEFYLTWHKEHFGERPDDWTLYTRTFTDLPSTMRFELTEDLRDKYGWEVYGLWVESVPHFDGKRYNQKDYLDRYAQPCSSYTRLPRLLIKTRQSKKAVQP